MTFRGYLRRRNFRSSKQLGSVSAGVDKDDVSDGPSRVSLSTTSLILSTSMPLFFSVHSEQFSYLVLVSTVGGTAVQKFLQSLKSFLLNRRYPVH